MQGSRSGGYTFPLVLLQQLASRKQQGSLHGSDAPDTIMRHSCRSDLLHSTACIYDMQSTFPGPGLQGATDFQATGLMVSGFGGI